jgi:2,5-furandicarboxylate decarboxylase 1
MLSNTEILDTRFRSTLARLADAGRLTLYTAPVDSHLEAAALMKRLDAGPALLFETVEGFDMPVVGNLFSCPANCEAGFGVGFRELRDFVGRALGNPQPPQLIPRAPVHEVVHRNGFDLRKLLPALHHTEKDGGRFVTAGIVIVRDPETGVYNASFHRLQIVDATHTAVKIDQGRHLGLAYERAKRLGRPLPVVVCLGTDASLYFTAATMGSQMPEDADELAVAGGLCGRPLPVAKALTQDLVFPAETEITLEGEIAPDGCVAEGPFGEFIGYLSPRGDAPVLTVTAVTHRRRPIYHAINGYGRETIVLRKYVLEASLLKVLRAAVPIVTDVEMTAGGLHRFHAVIQVRKTGPQHNGLQRNAIAASFGALKDLDFIIVVDDDIDLRDPADVEYALATRFEASRDQIMIPGARGHEYVRAGDKGIRTKLALDATVPFEEQGRFRRVQFQPIEPKPDAFTSDRGRIAAVLAL